MQNNNLKVNTTANLILNKTNRGKQQSKQNRKHITTNKAVQHQSRHE